MNKPKIYGFSEAGSKYEIPHKEDFENCAAYLTQHPDETGVYVLERGKSYRIKNTSSSGDWGFAVKAVRALIGTPITIANPSYDKWADGFTFKYLGFDVLEDLGDGSFNGNIVYEQNGIRKTQIESMTYGIEKVIVEGADDVVLINENGKLTVIGEKGEKGDKGDINENLYSIRYGEEGFVSVDGTITPSYPNGERASQLIPVNAGEKYVFQVWMKLADGGGYWSAYAFYDVDGNIIGERPAKTIEDSTINGYAYGITNITVPTGAVYMRVSARTYGDGRLKVERGEVATDFIYHYADIALFTEVEKQLKMAVALQYARIIPSINTGEIPSISTSKKMIHIPADTLLLDERFENGYVSLKETTYCWADTAITSSALSICFDIKNLAIEAFNYNMKIDPNRYMLIATVRLDSYNNGAGKVASPLPMMIDGKFCGVVDVNTATMRANKTNGFIRAVNHRGYCTEAPENTLSAFKLSKKKGFEYVECDVSFTSDGVPVLLHDLTLNRTAKLYDPGTGETTELTKTVNISEISYTELSGYEVGSWFSSEYTGEPIPRFKEFLVLCKRLGLKPYVELKTAPNEEQLNTLWAESVECGMTEYITWISFSSAALDSILTVIPKARLGLVSDEADGNLVDEWFTAKLNQGKDVFLDVSYASIDEGTIAPFVWAGIPVEAWTVNSASAIADLPSYISGYTSDNVLANEALYDAYID